jgi:hypothetical protein
MSLKAMKEMLKPCLLAIYVTRKAANDLDDSALQLVLGHKIAPVAKRHTGQQIQQRLLDSTLAI